MVSPLHAANDDDALIAQMRKALQDGDAKGWNEALSKWQVSHGDNAHVPIENVKVEGKDLSQFRFKQIALSNCSFRECSFTDTRFERCHLTGTGFSKSNFSGVTLNHCFVDRTEMEGRFEALKVYGSVLANSCIEGVFASKPGSDGYSRFSNNELITCTTITRRIAAGEKPELDLQHGVLQFAENRKPANGKGDTGVHNTQVQTIGADLKPTTHDIGAATLNNGVLDTNCAVTIGGPERVANYAAPTSPEDQKKADRELRRSLRADISMANTKTTVYSHGATFGPDMINAMSDGLSINRATLQNPWPSLTTVGFSMQQAKIGGTELSTFGVGPRYSFTGGKDGPRVNYRTALDIGGGSISFPDVHNIRGNTANPDPEAKKDFTKSFMAVIPSVTVGTWLGNVGVEGGVRWPIALSGPKVHEGVRLSADSNVPSGGTYSITMGKVGIMPTVNASVKYNMMHLVSDGSVEGGQVSVVLRADMLPKTKVAYDASQTVNGHTDVYSGVSKAGGVRYSAGVILGF